MENCLYLVNGLCKVCDQILGILQTAAQADQIGAYTGSIQLLVGHLTVGCGGRMQAAGTGVCHMGLDSAQLHMLHEGFGCFTAAMETKGDNAAGAVRHVFLGDLIVLIAGQAAVLDPLDLGIRLQKLCDLLGIAQCCFMRKGRLSRPRFR